VDLKGWAPEGPQELDLFGNVIPEQLYQRPDFGRELVIKTRREVVARRITQMLYKIGRMTKTIVFCTDVEEADAMRQLLVSLNADMVKEDPRYVMRITGDDAVGKKELGNFLEPSEPYPVVVTTSEMLSTGADCKTCGLIVIDKEIGSMTEFKQIVGRGTRLKTDKGKWHFEILDFRNATQMFKDPEFDGEPEMPEEPVHSGGGGMHENVRPYNPGPKKYYINHVEVKIDAETVSYLGADGKTQVVESFTDFTRKNIRGKFATLDDFIKRWTAEERKAAVVDELKEYDVLIDAIREANPDLAKVDVFDIICHVAFDQKPLTRSERANNVKKRNYLAKYEGKAREVLEALLVKYADDGILQMEQNEVLKLDPFSHIGTVPKIMKLFGGREGYEAAVIDLKKQLYLTDDVA